MTEYLRTCLAWSCGIKQPYVKEISDWMEQAPRIALYNPSDRRTDQPAKQQKLTTERGDINQSILLYSRLLIKNIEIQASTIIITFTSNIFSIIHNTSIVRVIFTFYILF